MTSESQSCSTAQTASQLEKNIAQPSATPTKRVCVCCGKDISSRRETARTCGKPYCAKWAVKHTPKPCGCGRPGTILKDGWCCERCDAIEKRNDRHRHELSTLRESRRYHNKLEELGWLRFAEQWLKDEMRLMRVASYRERMKAIDL